jgi:hypothetical protein
MVTNLNCDRVFNIAIDAHAGNGFSLAFDCQAGADFAVTVVDYSSDETQSTPAALSLSQPWAHYPAISSDASGSQLIAWNVAAGTNSQVQARFKPHNGNWQSVTNISQPNVLGKAQVTPRGMSAFAVAWDPPTPHAELINAAVFGTSFGWSSEQVLSPASAHSTNPLLATDGHNGVITAWIATENGTSVLQSRYLPADELPDTGALPQWLWWIAAAAIGAGVFLRRMRAR